MRYGFGIKVHKRVLFRMFLTHEQFKIFNETQPLMSKINDYEFQ